MVTFAIIGVNDMPLYTMESEQVKGSGGSRSSTVGGGGGGESSNGSSETGAASPTTTTKFAHLNQFIMHASLDVIHDTISKKNDMYVIII